MREARRAVPRSNRPERYMGLGVRTMKDLVSHHDLLPYLTSVRKEFLTDFASSIPFRLAILYVASKQSIASTLRPKLLHLHPLPKLHRPSSSTTLTMSPLPHHPLLTALQTPETPVTTPPPLITTPLALSATGRTSPKLAPKKQRTISSMSLPMSFLPPHFSTILRPLLLQMTRIEGRGIRVEARS